MQILETERLTLRHQELADLDQLFALYGNPAITQYIPDAPRTYEEAREELMWHMNGHPARPELGLWTTIHKETGAYLGRCGLLPWTIDGQNEVEVAYLISQAHWGQGFGTEAALALRDYGFYTLNIPRLLCLIDAENVASIKVAEKIGMVFEREAEDELGPFLLYAQNRTQARV